MSAPVLSWLFNTAEKDPKAPRLAAPLHAIHSLPAGQLGSARGQSSFVPQVLVNLWCGSNCSTLRANLFPEVTDLSCRLPLPTLFYRLEATHRPDAVMSTTRGENHVSPGFSRGVERAQDTTNMQCFPNGRTSSPAKLIPR